MTKKEIKLALKNNGVKGYSRAVISLDTGWVVVGDYAGKIKDGMLELKPVDLNDKESRHYVIKF